MSPSLNSRENRELACEVKFEVPRPIAEQIREWARIRLSPDPNGSGQMGDAYHISSLYFDTEQFDVFRRNGSHGRTRYRIRRYGPSEIAFLERKLKTRGLVTKRRASVHVGELQRLSETAVAPEWIGFWYYQRIRLRRLRPICQVSYLRTARVSTTAYGPIRLTLDESIVAQPACGLAFAPIESGSLISDGHVIVELKYRIEMPAIFKELVGQFALNPKRISKYRMAVVGLGFVSEPAPKPAPETPICLNS